MEMAERRVGLEELTPMMKVTVWSGGCGRGGTVVKAGPDGLVLMTKNAERLEYPVAKITSIKAKYRMPAEECIAFGSGDCSGEVDHRMYGTRCEKHFEQRLELEDQLRSRYPEQQPADFDPAYAGETW